MPSVASDPSVVQSYQLPQPRVPAGNDGQDAAATPFAMLLDSALPPETPAAPPPRNEQADRSERAEARADHSDDTAPARDRAAEDTAPAKDSKDAKDAKDTKETKDTNDCGESKDCKDTKETEKKPDADPEQKAEVTAEAEPKLDAAAAAIFISNGTAAPTTPVAAEGEAVDAAAVVAAPKVEAPVAPAPVEATAPDAADQTAALAAAAETADAPVAAKPEGDAKKPEGEAKAPGKTAEAAAASSASETPKVTPVEAGEQEQSQTGNEQGAKPAPAEDAKAAKVEKPAQAAEAPAPAKPSFDVLQNLGLSAPSSQASATAFMHAAPALAASAAAAPNGPATTAQAVPMAGVAVEIATQAQAGKNRFEIRLDPPELGRIDVRLDIDREGNVSTRLVVERAETLDLLRRDANQLERALQQAGLKTADNSLQFSLRDQSFQRDERNPQNTARIVVPDEGSAPLEVTRRGTGIRGLGSGIDIRV